MTSRIRARVFALALIQLALLTVVDSQLTGPVDTCALVDTQIQLNCSWPNPDAGNFVQWIYANATVTQPIYQSPDSDVLPSVSQEYGIEIIDETNEFNLIVKSVTFELAGRRLHSCSLGRGDQPKYSAFVVAVENVQCPNSGEVVEVEGSQVLVECIVRYASYLDQKRPWLNWTAEGIDNQISQNYETNVTHAWSHMNLTLESTYDEMNFTCDMSFEGGVPDYTDSCTTVLYVLYGVKNISFQPEIIDGDDVTAGTVITCIANGRPAPSLMWYDENNNNTVGSGAELTVSDDMVGPDLLTFTCYATNNISDATYTELKTLSFRAIAAPSAEVSTNSVETWVIVVSVVVPVAVILIVTAIVVFIILRRRRQQRKDKRQANGTAAATIPMSVTATQQTAPGENQPFLYSASTDPPAPVAAPRPLSDGSNGAPVGMGFADLGRGTQSPTQPGLNGVDGRGPGSQYGGSLSRVNTPNNITYPYQPSGRLTPGSAVVPAGRGTPGPVMAGPPSVAAYGATPAGGASRAGSTGRMTPGSAGPGVDLRPNPTTGGGYPYQQRPSSTSSASTVSHSASSYHGSQHGGQPPPLSLPPNRSMDAASHVGSLV